MVERMMGRPLSLVTSSVSDGWYSVLILADYGWLSTPWITDEPDVRFLI